MTWIKPSFLWMMYRCGWASKTGQERVLAIDIKREAFDYIVKHAVLSHYDSTEDITEYVKELDKLRFEGIDITERLPEERVYDVEERE